MTSQTRQTRHSREIRCIFVAPLVYRLALVFFVALLPMLSFTGCTSTTKGRAREIGKEVLQTFEDRHPVQSAEALVKVEASIAQQQQQILELKTALVNLKAIAVNANHPFFTNMRDFRDQTSVRLNTLERQMDDLMGVVAAFSSTKASAKVDSLPGSETVKPEDIYNDHRWPEAITNRGDIVTIAEIVLGPKTIRTSVADRSEMADMARTIRDAIISHYPDQWELSDVNNPGIRLDIVSIPGSGRDAGNMDFFIDWAKDSLVPIDHLQWIRHE